MSNVEVVILILGIVLVAAGLFICEELIDRFVFKRKKFVILIPSGLYMRLRKKSYYFHNKPDVWIHDKLIELLNQLCEDIDYE